MVYWSQLSALLSDCFICNLPAKICKIRQQGFMIEVNLKCIKNHITTWYSSPTIKRMAETNLTLSAAILWKYMNWHCSQFFPYKKTRTYRQLGIRSYMKKCYSDIKHQFDVWHVSKSIKKSWEKFQKSVTTLA